MEFQEWPRIHELRFTTRNHFLGKMTFSIALIKSQLSTFYTRSKGLIYIHPAGPSSWGLDHTRGFDRLLILYGFYLHCSCPRPQKWSFFFRENCERWLHQLNLTYGSCSYISNPKIIFISNGTFSILNKSRFFAFWHE